jgi:hypothetical protein
MSFTHIFTIVKYSALGVVCPILHHLTLQNFLLSVLFFITCWRCFKHKIVYRNVPIFSTCIGYWTRSSVGFMNFSLENALKPPDDFTLAFLRLQRLTRVRYRGSEKKIHLIFLSPLLGPLSTAHPPLLFLSQFSTRNSSSGCRFLQHQPPP